MRNQIGIPPVDREVDSPNSFAPNSAAAKVSRAHHHAGMRPEIEEAARHDDLPYVGGYDKPVTERDTNVGLYVGIAIGVFALIIIAMIFSAFF
jgi:hypothetical protein